MEPISSMFFSPTTCHSEPKPGISAYISLRFINLREVIIHGANLFHVFPPTNVPFRTEARNLCIHQLEIYQSPGSNYPWSQSLPCFPPHERAIPNRSQESLHTPA